MKRSLAAGIRPSPEEMTAHSLCNHLTVGTWLCVSTKLCLLVSSTMCSNLDSILEEAKKKKKTGTISTSNICNAPQRDASSEIMTQLRQKIIHRPRWGAVSRRTCFIFYFLANTTSLCCAGKKKQLRWKEKQLRTGGVSAPSSFVFIFRSSPKYIPQKYRISPSF